MGDLKHFKLHGQRKREGLKDKLINRLEGDTKQGRGRGTDSLRNKGRNRTGMHHILGRETNHDGDYHRW